jgi:hypothetical protein
MAPRTSTRKPVIAGARPRQLSAMLRAWRRQPRRRSPLLFWTLLVLAIALDTALFFLGAQLLGALETPLEPPPERRGPVRFAADAELWEPLRHWVVRVRGRTRLFESFCREAVRRITGRERFEQRDPLAVVVSWMLDGRTWDHYPFVRCDDAELRAVLYRDDNGPSRMSRAEQLQGRYVEPIVPRGSDGFLELLRGIRVKSEAGAIPLSALERQALALRERLALWQRITNGIVDGGDGAEIRTARAALRQTYESNSRDLFAAALNDFLAASRRALHGVEDAAVSRRLACEAWFNEHRPVQQAEYGSLWAIGLLAAGTIAGRRWPLLRRGLLLGGQFACAWCLAWSLAAMLCQTIRDEVPPLSDGLDVLLWASTLAVGLGLVLGKVRREPLFLLAGAAVSGISFVLANRLPSSFAAQGLSLPPSMGSNGWLLLQGALLVSAYALLMLAWGLAVLTLTRLLARPPSSERLRGLANLCLGPIRLAIALLAASALLDTVRALLLGASRHSWSAQALGTLVALPGCLALLHARRKGWIGPFGMTTAIVLGSTLLAMMGHAAALLATGARPFARLTFLEGWVWAAGLANLSVAANF